MLPWTVLAKESPGGWHGAWSLKSHIQEARQTDSPIPHHSWQAGPNSVCVQHRRAAFPPSLVATDIKKLRQLGFLGSKHLPEQERSCSAAGFTHIFKKGLFLMRFISSLAAVYHQQQQVQVFAGWVYEGGSGLEMPALQRQPRPG